jgi:uncharacterized protein YcbX
MTTVEQLWRYPVKSMLGSAVPAVQLGPLGIEGDRTWATRDLRRGGIRGAKQIGGLMELAASYPDGDATQAPLIRLPDGAIVVAGAPGADERISDAIGHPVRLEPLAPATDLDHYRRGPSEHADPLEAIRAVFALETSEPLPDFSAFPPELAEFESPPGTYYDAWPLLVLTTASLRELQRLAPASVIDVRRFRPSILLHDDGDGFVEQSWSGRRALLGTAVIELGAPCPRCIMTTRAFAGLPEDRSIMRTLVRENHQALGVYGTVVQPGTVRVGDELQLLD